MRRHCFQLALLLLTGCATTAPRPAVAPVWPPPPDAPRIAYVRSLDTLADLGVRRSGFGKILDWLSGTSRELALGKPFGVALDEHDNLCVTDTANGTVSFFDRAANRGRRWDRVDGVAFIEPVAVAKTKIGRAHV